MAWVQRREREGLAALDPPGPSQRLGPWALAAGSGLSKPQADHLQLGKVPFTLPAHAPGNLPFFPS